MPFRKTYEINNREEGKAAERDQSYRSCLITLFIFFFMCLILILSCIPWKIRDRTRHEDSYIKSETQHYDKEHRKKATTQETTERTIISRTLGSLKTIITSIDNKPTKDINTITEDYSKDLLIKEFSHFEHSEKISEDKTLSSVSTFEEDIEKKNWTKEALRNIENNDLSTLLLDTTTDNVNNDSKSIEESTTKSTDGYYNTESNKAEVDIIINATISTMLNRSNYLKENSFKNFTEKLEKLRINDDNANFLTTSTVIESEGSTIKHSSNNYSTVSQLEATTSNAITLTGSNSDEGTEISMMKYSNHEESIITEYHSTLINENETETNFPSTINYISLMDKKISTSMEIENKTENKVNETIMDKRSYISEKYNASSNEMKKYNIFSTFNYMNATDASVFDNMTTPIIPIDYSETNFKSMMPDDDINICNTGYCKQIASKLLSYMNHSADPCDDFYEYACGGFEVNPQLIDEDLVQRSRNYERIADQLLKEKRKNVNSTFATYYDSCVQYEKNMNFSERMKMANEALKKIGKFYIPATWHNNYNFTNLLSQLILHHSALLFDIVPELDEYHPNSFTLKIGPTTYESPFKTDYAEDPCSEDKLETKERYVNLELLYNDYRRCKNDKSEFKRSIKEALIELNVFKGLNDSYLEQNKQFEYIEKTIHVIDSILIEEFFSNFPFKSEIREAYLMNNYTKITVNELQSSSNFVSWNDLIYSLTGLYVVTSEHVQVYFHAALTKGLRKLEKYAKEDAMGLNNAIMGLYAHKIYYELVLLKRDNVKNYCLHVSTNLLQLEASSLYISSFTDHEIERMDKIIEKMFNELKQALSRTLLEATWARGEGQKELLRKINSLKLALPVVSYFKNRDSLYNEYNVSEINLSDNYFKNSMTLLERYRTLMYTELRRQVGDPKQIWTYYTVPFQSKAQVIYPLNLVVIPYGIIDWSIIKEFLENEVSFDYLLWATLGNLIAHQIAHHFDTNGIHYWNQTRNTQDSLMFENEFTDTHFDDYVNCQKENLYQDFMNITLPFTEQIVSFKIPRLTLNERLSEVMGVRLAYDTLALTESNAKRLPWIQLRIQQLFYLAYAQMYCTKTPLTSSYISLYESEDLPSRIRVFVSASNNEFVAKEWNCPLGSQIAPTDVCSVFPYIETKETAMIPE